MIIGYLSDLPAPGQPALSGVPKVAESFLRQLEGQSQVRIEAINLVNDLPAPVIKTRGAVTYRHLPCKSRWKTATFFRSEVRLLHRLLRDLRCDLAHGQPTVYNLTAASTSGLPNLLTIHGLLGREAKVRHLASAAFWQGQIREWMQLRAARKTNHIVSISPYVDHYLKGRTQAQIWSIPNPIDDTFFNLPPMLPAATPLRLLCIGTVSIRKNQQLIVEACSILKRTQINFQCRIVGVVEPSVRSIIVQRIADHGLAASVELTGPVSKDRVFESYTWANAVLLPSKEETAPLSIIQAMAAGRPAFGADAAGTPLLLEQGRWGTLFNGSDPAHLASVLQDYASSPGPVLEKAAKARAFAETQFRQSSVVERTLDLYRTVLGERKPSA